MHCEKCGHKISPNDRFCEKCGERSRENQAKVKVSASMEEKRVIRKWSWGGFVFGWVYFVFMRGRFWLTILLLISQMVPFLNIASLIYLGIEGRKFAWDMRDWKDFDEYEDTQRKWDTWAIIIFALSIISAFASAWNN